MKPCTDVFDLGLRARPDSLRDSTHHWCLTVFDEGKSVCTNPWWLRNVCSNLIEIINNLILSVKDAELITPTRMAYIQETQKKVLRDGSTFSLDLAITKRGYLIKFRQLLVIANCDLILITCTITIKTWPKIFCAGFRSKKKHKQAHKETHPTGKLNHGIFNELILFSC